MSGSELVARLTAAGIDNAEREAQWLVEEVTGTRGRRCLRGPNVFDPAQAAHLESLVARRTLGEPLQYVLGHWPFRTLDLLVDARALIPRPETEQVAEVALAELGRLAYAEPVVVDLGTGTGALALSVAAEVSTARVWAVEVSADALTLAAQNRTRVGLDVDRVELIGGSWFDALPGKLRAGVDLIVANPPYVATDDAVDTSVVDWEPAGALFAGADGLDALRKIVTESPRWLTSRGVVVCEIGATQGDAVIELASEAGFATSRVWPDLSGRDRIVVCRMGR